jgi:hypothetical protein
MNASTDRACAVVGEFRKAEDVVRAVRQLRDEGFRRWEVYAPAPLEELVELAPPRRGRYITAIMVAGAVMGACFGYFIQYWGSVLSYPLNVGGRPYNGWPGLVPSAWEVCALFTVYAGFFAFLAFCRLPRLYHPIFAVERFERASQDRFFVCLPVADDPGSAERARRIMSDHAAVGISEIEP